MGKVTLADKFDRFNETWTPKIVGTFNGNYVKLAKAHGEMVWHSHADEDELFLVVKGELTIQLRDGAVVLRPGEFYIVPKGVEHAPRATEETHIVLIEPTGTKHTGDVESAMTVETEDQAWI